MILTMTGGELPECMTPEEEKRKASFFFFLRLLENRNSLKNLIDSLYLYVIWIRALQFIDFFSQR